MRGVYLEDFSCRADVERDFHVTLASEVKILFAWYGSGGYDGTAFVLFKRGGKLFEVNGSHCSCNGLEGQWEPEETTKEALRFRIEKGTLGRDSYTSGGIFGPGLLDKLKKVRL